MCKLWLAFIVLLTVQGKYPAAQGFISAAIGIASVGISYLAGFERCTETYVKLNYTGLKNDLENKLYGQHLVSQTLLKSVRAHFHDPNPPKPLVLSFHGLTGVGKNFVSKILVDNIYKKKDKSSFVHLFNSEVHFKHQKCIDTYKDQLHEWLYHNVSKCGRSLFVFDEMDHMPESLIDILAPFLDYASHIDGVDFRKCIFIFLSNTGGSKIGKIALEAWRNGDSRESIRLRDVQEVLMLSAYNEDGGLKRSKLVRKNLIDHFIPFLPLERSHVRECVRNEMKRQHARHDEEEDVENVLHELLWYPKGVNVYATSGCKKVAQKVALLM